MKRYRVIHIFYALIYLFLVLFLLKALYAFAINSFFEQDLLWFMPIVSQSIQGLSPAKLIKFLLSPFPIMYGVPSLKFYAFIILNIFGPLNSYFVFTSIVFHIASSILLFLLSKRLGLGLLEGFLSSITYLALYAHFGAYVWPMAMQHLLVVFFTLAVLNLYFKTNDLINKKAPYAGYYAATLAVNFIASFCRVSIAILPLSILTHILFSSDNKTRLTKYYLWLPLFISYLFYPLITLAYLGDNRINVYLSKGGHNLFYYILFFVGGIAAMLLFGLFLRFVQKMKIDKGSIQRIAIFLVATAYLLLVARNVKNIMLPYNILVPFVGMVASFLNPLQNVLAGDTPAWFYCIKVQASATSFLLTLSVIAFCWHIARRDAKYKALMIFIPWYLFSARYLNLFNPIDSRYYIYLSPIFCIGLALFSSKIFSVRKEIILPLVFAALCIPNILAIRLHILREKLPTNFPVFDYIKIADAVKSDMVAKDLTTRLKADKVYIDGVPRMDYDKLDFVRIDLDKFDNFRFVFAQTFRDRKMAGININRKPPNVKEARVYYLVKDGEVYDAGGANADMFGRLFEEAMANLKRRDYKKALSLFRDAIAKRPFLANYLLGSLELKDLKWIVNTPDLRTWIQRTIYSYSLPDGLGEREKRISLVLNNDIDRLIQCFFYASYINFISGDTEESKRLFSSIQFLDSDYGRLYDSLTKTEPVKSDKAMISFLNRFDGLSLFTVQDYRNTYEFEKFLFDLISE